MSAMDYNHENKLPRSCGSDASACSPSYLTPETDALEDKIYARGIRMIEIRMLQHARKMEKERNMARATASTFRQCAELTFGVMPFPRKFHWENAGCIARELAAQDSELPTKQNG